MPKTINIDDTVAYIGTKCTVNRIVFNYGDIFVVENMQQKDKDFLLFLKNCNQIRLSARDFRKIDKNHYFKPGDKITCIDESYHYPFLMVNKTFIVHNFTFAVDDTDRDLVSIYDGNTLHYFPATAFKLADSPNIIIGDTANPTNLEPLGIIEQIERCKNYFNFNPQEGVVPFEQQAIKELTLRITNDVYTDLAKLAAKADVKFSDFITDILIKGIHQLGIEKPGTLSTVIESPKKELCKRFRGYIQEPHKPSESIQHFIATLGPFEVGDYFVICISPNTNGFNNVEYEGIGRVFYQDRVMYSSYNRWCVMPPRD